MVSPRYYAIIPDFSTDCAQGCGSTPLEGLYLTVSHELVDAVTDPDVGANNLAWYDDANGEIGDICGGFAGTASGETVQLMWSNEAHGCRDHKAAGLDTVQVTPAEQTVIAGSTTTFALALSPAYDAEPRRGQRADRDHERQRRGPPGDGRNSVRLYGRRCADGDVGQSQRRSDRGRAERHHPRDELRPQRDHHVRGGRAHGR